MSRRAILIGGLVANSEFPDDLLDEARANPGGWVYEIDPRYDPNGEVPFTAIIKAWKISDTGEPTGEIWENDDYTP